MLCYANPPKPIGSLLRVIHMLLTNNKNPGQLNTAKKEAPLAEKEFYNTFKS